MADNVCNGSSMIDAQNLFSISKDFLLAKVNEKGPLEAEQTIPT